MLLTRVKAEAEAAQKASTLKAAGKADEAAQWNKVRKTIHELRSGHVSCVQVM